MNPNEPPRREGLTYKDAGVDIDLADNLVDRIKKIAGRASRPEVIGGIGGFGGLFAVPRRPGLSNPVLVAGTDGVGTKLKIAFLTGRHKTVGIDLVAMCVNDVLTLGAEPLFFLDYFATGKLEIEVATDVIAGITAGCRLAGCALLGGETAELPSFYAPGEYDLAGFAVGVVDRDAILDGRAIRPGDALIGILSSGLHSNGYSLVRKVFFENLGLRPEDRVPELGGAELATVLLEPTRIYVKPIAALVAKGAVKAMAHITGGGIEGNLARPFPEGCRARVWKAAWTPPPIFSLMLARGGVDPDDAWRTFNMGIGMILVVGAGNAGETIAHLEANGEKAVSIGEVVAGDRGVDLV